jgi:hypothetical protein
VLVAPVLAFVLAAAPVPPPDTTPPSAEVRARVRSLLGAIHRPVDAQAYRNMGPGAEAALAEFAVGDDFPSRRIRALQGLASLGGPRAEAVHRQVAASAAPSAVRQEAVRGLARLAPQSAAPALAGFLEQDRDPGVRATAAEALAATSPGECSRIRARARLETEAGLYGHALSQCDRSQPAPGER